MAQIDEQVAYDERALQQSKRLLEQIKNPFNFVVVAAAKDADARAQADKKAGRDPTKS